MGRQDERKSADLSFNQKTNVVRVQPEPVPVVTTLAEKKTGAVTVVAVIALRLVVEVFLGLMTKAVYDLQPNPAINLVCTNIFMGVMCITLNLVNKLFPLMPSVFGGSWSVQWSAVVGLLIPTACLCGSILLKQNIISNTGPGLAEMIAGIGVPVSAVIQYFVNGVKIGYLGIASCVVATGCFCACIGGATWGQLVGGFAAACLNVTRASMTKKSNANFKLSAGLNLLYTCVLGLPFYIIMVPIGQYWLYSDQIFFETTVINGVVYQARNWTLLFHWYGKFPYMPVATFGIQLFLALASNIVVFVLYDIASPLTYVISAGLKGVIQVFFDIFYIDYKMVVWFHDKLGFLKNYTEQQLMKKFRKKGETTKLQKWGFGLKCLYFCLYATEKVIAKITKKKQADAVAAAKEMEISSTSSDESK